MVIILRPVIGRAAQCRGVEFGGQRSRPLFPREMALFAKLHRQREGLGLPRLRKDGAARVARQTRQLPHIRNWITPAQGSPPTDPDILHPAERPASPITRTPRIAPSIRAAVSRLRNARSNPGTRSRPGGGRSSPV